MKKSLYGGSAVTAAALMAASFFTYAKPLIAEANPFQQPSSQQPKREDSQDQQLVRPRTVSPVQPATPEVASSGVILNSKVAEPAEAPAASEAAPVAPANPVQTYMATAYSLRGRTASGRYVAKGLIAADPAILPLGSRVLVEAGAYSGEYLVADTGGAVRGRHIDIWIPSTREAMRFGRRSVKLTVLSYGARRSAARRRAQH